MSQSFALLQRHSLLHLRTLPHPTAPHSFLHTLTRPLCAVHDVRSTSSTNSQRGERLRSTASHSSYSHHNNHNNNNNNNNNSASNYNRSSHDRTIRRDYDDNTNRNNSAGARKPTRNDAEWKSISTQTDRRQNTTATDRADTTDNKSSSIAIPSSMRSLSHSSSSKSVSSALPPHTHKLTPTRRELDGRPRINITDALSTIVRASDEATERIMPKTVPIPAGLQVTAGDEILAAFDPATDAKGRSKYDQPDTIASFINGREVISDHRGRDEHFDLARVGEFSSTQLSGLLDKDATDILPDIAGDNVLTADTKSRNAVKIINASRTALTGQLTNLLATGSEYHQRALETQDAMHKMSTATTGSPFAPRTQPPMRTSDPTSNSVKTRELREMEAVFEVLEARGYPRTIHHTLMLSAYGREGFLPDAERMFNDMIENKQDQVPHKFGSFFPDTVTCNSMLAIYSTNLQRFHHSQLDRAAVLEKARGIFRTMMTHRIRKDTITYTSMIQLLANEGIRTPNPDARAALLKESLELYEFMQTPTGGQIRPNRRTFSILMQSFAAHGDFTASKKLLENMMRTYQLFPNMAIMNGLIRATAYGCGRNVSLEGKEKCNIEPVHNVISFMKKLKLLPTEHTIASVIKGLSMAGQVQTAKDLHARLDSGSLGTAQPTRMTYTALLSVLISDHNQSMASCLQTYEEALKRGDIFKSPVKRKGTVLDLRHLGEHPELFSIAITKQLNNFLQSYTKLQEEAEKQRQAATSRKEAKKFDEYWVLDQIIPERGWLLLTGRHRGDTPVQQGEENDLVIDDIVFSEMTNSSAVDTSLDHLEDQFPDDGDYSEYDTTGVLKQEKEVEEKKDQQRARHKQAIHLTPRQASRMNTLNTVKVNGSYGKVVDHFLMAQTPSLQSVVTQQFEKTKGMNKTPSLSASSSSTTAAAASSPSSDVPPAATFLDDDDDSTFDQSDSISSSSTSAPRRERRPPPELAKTDELNEGMLIVRRPVIHFWLQCHAHVLAWHKEANEKKLENDASASSLSTLLVPPPSFLPHHQQGSWWRRLAESIEVQHGLAELQSSREYATAKEAEEQRIREEKRKMAFSGTRRDGSKFESKGRGERYSQPKSKQQLMTEKADWSVRKRSPIMKARH